MNGNIINKNKMFYGINEDACPFCGDNRYLVTRSDAWDMDAYGNETHIEDGGELIATCLGCGKSIYVPSVEAQNKAKRKSEREEVEAEPIMNGYKKVCIDDVMEKYGIEVFEDLDNIIVNSGMWMDYGDDYEECYNQLLQDMYDIPAIFCTCIDYANLEATPEAELKRRDEYYDTALELSRMPCENLKYWYDVTPTIFVGTKDEPMQIYINGVPIDETVELDNPCEFHFAIDRARDKYYRR